jgi:hypothetical protein
VKKKKIKSTLFFLLLKIAAFFGIYKKMREFFTHLCHAKESIVAFGGAAKESVSTIYLHTTDLDFSPPKPQQKKRATILVLL